MAQYVPYYQGDTTKKIITRQIDNGDLFPFEDIKIEGAWGWKSNNIGGAEGSLKLEDFDIRRGVSGAVKLKVAKGWKVRMIVTSNNFDYFNDNIQERYYDVTNPTNQVDLQSRIDFTMDGNTNDYISIDVDSEVAGIAAFALRINGEMVNVSDPKKMNDECYLNIVAVTHFEDIDEPPTSEEINEEVATDLRQDRVSSGQITIDEETTPPTSLEWVFGGIVLAIILAAGGVIALR